MGAGLLAVFLLVGAIIPGLFLFGNKIYNGILSRFTPKPEVELPEMTLPPTGVDDDETR